MDLSSIREEIKDIDWKAIDAKKKSSESIKQKEYLGGGNNMENKSTGGYGGGGNKRPSHHAGNRSGSFNRSASFSKEEEKEAVFWITEETYLDHAEKVIKELQAENAMITTSQIRNILSNISDIYNVVQRTKHSGDLPSEVRSKIRELTMHCYYAAGREDKVKKFFLRSSLFMNLKGILEASSETNKEMPETLRNVGEKERFLLLHKYMESLVAFQRFYGGKDS
jgi:CRISPR-associated protein, csm2 family